METTYSTDVLTETRSNAMLNYQRRKRSEAFQQALSEYRDTIGDWDLTDYQDAGPDWMTTSKLKCDCGRKLRYQYTVTNRETAETHKFGINHLQEETGFSNKVMSGITKQLNAADREIEQVEERLEENWTFKGIIPEFLSLPSDLQRAIDEGFPLSKKEEDRVIQLVLEAQRKEWESKRSENQFKVPYPKDPVNLFGEIDNTYEPKRTGAYHLTTSEKVIVDSMLQSGIGSATIIAEELHKATNHSGRYITGRTKIYPHCVTYLDELVETEEAELINNFGVRDRVYSR